MYSEFIGLVSDGIEKTFATSLNATSSTAVRSSTAFLLSGGDITALLGKFATDVTSEAFGGIIAIVILSFEPTPLSQPEALREQVGKWLSRHASDRNDIDAELNARTQFINYVNLPDQSFISTQLY